MGKVVCVDRFRCFKIVQQKSSNRCEQLCKERRMALITTMTIMIHIYCISVFEQKLRKKGGFFLCFIFRQKIPPPYQTFGTILAYVSILIGFTPFCC